MSLLGSALKSNGALATRDLTLLGFAVDSTKYLETADNDSQAALEAHGEISKTEALALASVNLEKLLGVEVSSVQSELVATRGGSLLDFGSRVVSIISSARGVVDLM